MSRNQPGLRIGISLFEGVTNIFIKSLGIYLKPFIIRWIKNEVERFVFFFFGFEKIVLAYFNKFFKVGIFDVFLSFLNSRRCLVVAGNLTIKILNALHY